MNTQNKTIVAFHTGRGGRFYNGGHRTFIGSNPISYYTHDLFINFENIDEVSDAIGERDNLNLIKLLQKAIEGDDNSVNRLNQLGLNLGEQIYTDCCGNPVGLTVEEAETGTGCINIDNEYDTTTCIYLSDCTEDELKLILAANHWNSTQLIQEYFDNNTDLNIDWSIFNGNYKGLIDDYFTFYDRIALEDFLTIETE